MSSRLILFALLPFAFANCPTCQQQATQSGVSTDYAQMGAKLGRQMAERLRFMSYPTQKSTFTAADFPPSLFASLGLSVRDSSSPQATPQFPMNMIRPQQPNQQVLIPKGNCPYCRNRGK